MKNPHYDLLKLPSDVQVSLYLIGEELKSRKLFLALHEIGLDHSYFQPHLDSLILQSLRMEDDTDETFDMYFEILERRSKKIGSDYKSIMKQAIKVYFELMNVKKQRSSQKK